MPMAPCPRPLVEQFGSRRRLGLRSACSEVVPIGSFMRAGVRWPDQEAPLMAAWPRRPCGRASSNSLLDDVAFFFTITTRGMADVGAQVGRGDTRHCPQDHVGHALARLPSPWSPMSSMAVSVMVSDVE